MENTKLDNQNLLDRLNAMTAELTRTDIPEIPTELGACAVIVAEAERDVIEAPKIQPEPIMGEIASIAGETESVGKYVRVLNIPQSYLTGSISEYASLEAEQEYWGRAFSRLLAEQDFWDRCFGKESVMSLGLIRRFARSKCSDWENRINEAVSNSLLLIVGNYEGVVMCERAWWSHE